MKALASFGAMMLVGAAVLLLSIDQNAPHSDEQAPDQPGGAPPAAVFAHSTAPEPNLVRVADPHEPGPDVGRAEEPRTPETAIADRRDQLQARFEGQPVDASWAMQSRQQLNADLGKYTNADVRVRDVECRSSLCRIALASTNRDAQQVFVEQWVRHRTWTGPGFAVQDGDATIVYVSKPGVDLLD